MEIEMYIYTIRILIRIDEQLRSLKVISQKLWLHRQPKRVPIEIQPNKESAKSDRLSSRGTLCLFLPGNDLAPYQQHLYQR